MCGCEDALRRGCEAFVWKPPAAPPSTDAALPGATASTPTPMPTPAPAPAPPPPPAPAASAAAAPVPSAAQGSYRGGPQSPQKDVGLLEEDGRTHRRGGLGCMPLRLAWEEGGGTEALPAQHLQSPCPPPPPRARKRATRRTPVLTPSPLFCFCSKFLKSFSGTTSSR